MFRNSLNPSSTTSSSPFGASGGGSDEYYEFDGARLEIKHNASIRQSGVTIEPPKISNSIHTQSSILEGSDSILSPISAENNNYLDTRMSEPQQATNNSAPDSVAPAAPTTEVVPQAVVKPKVGSPRHFFCFRKGLLDQAISDCTRILLQPNDDLNVVGSWLLTIISHWDHERERIVILTKKSLWIVKFDFIAMRVLERERHELNKFDTIQVGQLTYPPSSIVPDRNETGIRLKWNKGQPLPTFSSWNPFAEIPWKTITNHPLGTYKDIYNSEKWIQEDLDKNQGIYLVDNLYKALLSIFKHPEPNIENGDVNYDCKLEEAPIVLENYLNVPAMVHNKNNFGFFKVRGKFSF